MGKEENNIDNSVNFKEIMTLLKEALTMYVHECQERITEQEEYELYKEQYPFDEYYSFEQEFRLKWE